MDGKTHRKVGTVVGAAAALLSTDDTQDLWKRIAEGLGGAIGGNVGARMPDWIEPALHSWHRDVGHSCTTIYAMVNLTPKVIRSWERYCRSHPHRARDRVGPRGSRQRDRLGPQLRGHRRPPLPSPPPQRDLVSDCLHPRIGDPVACLPSIDSSSAASSPQPS